LSDSEAKSVGETATVTPASTSYRWYVLAVLTTIFTIHALDRQLITIVLEPIKHAFDVSDTMLGFLSGTVYAVSFSLAGIPGAMLVDRINRRNLLAAAVALWSSATALSGFATSYIQLVLARIGLAVCEAPSLPSSASMLSDLFRQKERATAMGIYGMGLGLGQLIGFVGGGLIATHWGWREVFFMGGLPGLLMAIILVATIREPIRLKADGQVEQRGDAPGFSESIRFILSQRSLVRYFAGYVLMVVGTSATMAFLPSFYIRTHGVSLGHIGLFLGVGFGLANVAGSFLGGVIADRLGKHDLRWTPRLGALAAGIVLLSCLMLEAVDSVAISVTFLVLWGVAFTTQIGPYYALSQSLVGTRMRGTTIGTLNTLINVIAYGLGPLITGVLSDAYSSWAGNDALRYSMMTVALINIAAIIQFLRVGITLQHDFDRAAQL
jgi:predicted MFS family arabinose efflux permease